ncbi:MAG TPA: hypothetical protein VF812_07965 [Ktedonobacterales bacterium]
MVRADSKQDSDRPHFYSQYWIDVAMGKPSAAAVSAPSEAEEEEDDDLAFAAPQTEASKPKVSKAPEKKQQQQQDTGRSKLTSLADLANIDMLMKNSAAMDDTVTPDITASISDEEAPSVAGLDYDVETDAAADSPEGALASQDEDFYDYDEDEDEEDEDWGGSRRKKSNKPKRREHRDF